MPCTSRFNQNISLSNISCDLFEEKDQQIKCHLQSFRFSNGYCFLFQIKQTKSKFGFGTAFNARYITDSTHQAYQNFIYNNFEWAVPENALKWRQVEWTRVGICKSKQEVRGIENLLNNFSLPINDWIFHPLRKEVGFGQLLAIIGVMLDSSFRFLFVCSSFSYKICSHE